MRHWPLALVFVVLLIAARSERAVTLQSGDTAHCAADALVLASAVDARCVSFTATPTLTGVPAPTSTATATSTPVPTATDTATPVPTVMATTTPSAGMPLCPSHDATAWHALIDAAHGCHYDHEEGDDPNTPAIVAIFGPAGWYANGQTIGYVWATSAMENTHKHGGYKYGTRLNLPCDPNANYNGVAPVNCIVAMRVQYHAIPQALDWLTRFHSYYAEFKVCQYPAFMQCGIIRTGGWADFGVIESPYAGPGYVRPGGTVDFGMGSTYGGANSEIIMPLTADDPALATFPGYVEPIDNPYLSVPDMTAANLASFPLNPSVAGVSANAIELWNMPNILPCCNHYNHNLMLRFQFRVYDSWG